MSEPITGTGIATAAVTGVTLVSIFGPLDGPTVIGAFAGAAIFVMSAGDFSLLRRLFLGAVSLIAGLEATPFTVHLVEKVFRVPVDNPVGSLIASAAVVRTLMLLSSKDGPSFLSRFRGGGQ